MSASPLITRASALVALLTLSGCGLLVSSAIDKATEDAGYGEACDHDEPCQEGLVCVQALAVGQGQRPSAGYRCLRPCARNTSPCDDNPNHNACCAMAGPDGATRACFNPSHALCDSPITCADEQDPQCAR